MYAPFVEELWEIVRFQDVVRGEVDKIEILGWVISCQLIWSLLIFAGPVLNKSFQFFFGVCECVARFYCFRTI